VNQPRTAGIACFRPSATSTGRPISVATEATPSAIATGLRTPTASGPIFSQARFVRRPIAVASANASNEASSPIQTVSIPACSAATAISSLLIGAIEPERHHDAELTARVGGATETW
jgi:hypothetical protein